MTAATGGVVSELVHRSWVGPVLGLAFGGGVVLVLSNLPLLRRPGLEHRVGPYVQDVVRPSRLLSGARAGLGPHQQQVLMRQVVERLTHALDAALGGAVSVARRLDRAGLALDVAGFRAQQVLCGAGGLVLGALASTAIWAFRAVSVLPLTLLVLAGGACGVAGRDWYLSRQVQRREQELLAELPAIAEMLALTVSAGEGPLAGLRRVASMSDGALSDELRRTLADTHAGTSLVAALQALSQRTGLAALARFVDGVVVAVERGTPLAQVLRAQAQDVRQLGQRALMDAAGRKEVAMMVPVVFGILPVCVLFAVYPGYAFLRLGM